MNHLVRIFCIGAALLLAGGCFFQAGAQEETAAGVPEAGGAEAVFVIRTIAFNRRGRSLPAALMYHGELKTGERISGRAGLEAYLRQKWQLLYNQRVLESVSIEHTEGEAGEDGAIPVDLLITTVDSWNIIALPRPLLDDNDGFDLTIKARDYNFLGTMSPLRIDLGYNLKPEYVQNGFDGSKGTWNFEIDSEIPFWALGLSWNVNFDHFFSYVYEENTYYKNVTGLSVEIPAALPLALSSVTAGFDELFIVNEKNADRDAPVYGAYHKDWYMASEIYGQWKIPTGIILGSFGELSYTPKLSGRINYRPGGDVGPLRKGPSLSLSQSLGFGQINWADNFRSGLDAALSNGNTYNFYYQDWDNSIALSASGHLPLAPFFALSGRFQYRHWFGTYSDSAGDAIRGIVNNKLAADYMFSLNADFTFKVLDFRPSIWLKQPKLRFFDLEFQLAPIIDTALVKSPAEDAPRIQAGGGLELIIFSHFMRSLYLRASLAYNLRDLFKTGDFGGAGRELFIGLYHHY